MGLPGHARSARALPALSALVAAFSLCSLLATACTPQLPGATASPSPELPELRVTWFTEGPDLLAIQELAQQFQRQRKVRVKITLASYADIRGQLRSLAASAEPPDVVRVADVNEFRRELGDMRPYLKNPTAFTGQFFRPAMDHVIGKGPTVPGIPHELNLNGPLVNVDMFAKAGIKVPGAKDKPWTWEELLANARRAQQATGARHMIAFDRSAHRIATVLAQYDVRLFSPDGRKVGLEPTEKAAAVLKMFADWHTQDQAPSGIWLVKGSRASDFFVSGQVPVYFSGNWQVADYAQARRNIRFRWAAMPNPCAVNCGGYPGGKFLVLLKRSRNPRLATELLQFLSTREAMAAYDRTAVTLPTRNDLKQQGLRYSRQADMDVYLADLARTAEWTYTDSYHPLFSPLSALIEDTMAEVIAGTKTPEEAIARIRAEGDRRLVQTGLGPPPSPSASPSPEPEAEEAEAPVDGGK